MEKMCRFYIGDSREPFCNFRERTGTTLEPSMAEAIGEEGDWNENFDRCLPADRNREPSQIIAGQMQCNMYKKDIGESILEKFGIPKSFIVPEDPTEIPDSEIH